jgi:hypothetical protein
MYSTAHLKLRADCDDIKPKESGWGITPREVMSKPRFIITAIWFSFIPVMSIIIFLTTMIEHVVMRVRPTSIGKWVQRLGKDITVKLARHMMKDERNADMLYVIFGVSAIVIPLFSYCLYYELTNTGMLLYDCHAHLHDLILFRLK